MTPMHQQASLPTRSRVPRISRSGSLRVQERSLQDWLNGSSSSSRSSSFGLKTEHLQSPYRQIAWAYAAIRTIETSLMRLGLQAKSSDAEKAAVLPATHPISQLLQRVNPIHSQKGLLVSIAQHLFNHGECFLRMTDEGQKPIRFSGRGKEATKALPHYIWPFPGGRRRVGLECDSRGVPAYWIFPTAGGEKRVPAETVILLKFQDPDDPYRGMSPLEAAWGAATADYLAHAHQTELMSKGGDPKGVLQFKEFLPREQYDEIRDEVQEHWDAANASGETRIVHGGGEYKQTTMSPKELESPKLAELTRKEIAAVIGTPDALMGMGDSNFAVFKGEWRRFWLMTMDPLALLIGCGLNEELFQRLEGRDSLARIHWDFGAVRQLRDDLGERGAAAGTLQKQGVPLNMALAAAEIDIEAIEGGDVPLIQGQWTALAIAGEPPPEPEPEPEEEDEGDDEDPDEEPDGDLEGEEPEDEEPDEEDDEKAASGVTVRAAADESEGFTARRRLWRTIEARRKISDPSIQSKVRKWTNGMRGLQMEHFAKLRDAGKDQGEGKAVPCYSRSLPDIPDLAPLLDLWLEDAREFDAIPNGDERRHATPTWCDGTPICRIEADWTPRQLPWVMENLDLVREVGLYRLRDLAVCQKADLLESELDELIVMNDKKWIQQLRELLDGPFEGSYEGALRSFAGESGLPTVSAANPAGLRFLRDKGVRVSEGVNSTMARSLRNTIARVLSEGGTLGTLAQQIRASWPQVKAAGSKFFNQQARRSVLIARTETAQIHNTARGHSLEKWKDEGLIETRTYLTAGDGPESGGGRTREHHWTLDGKSEQIGIPWVSGLGNTLRWPADPEAPVVESANCRCAESADIKDTDE